MKSVPLPIPHRIILVSLVALALLAICATATANAEETDPRVEAGRTALDRWDDYPWYDDEADDLRPIDVKPAAPPQTATPTNWSGAANFIRWMAWVALAVFLMIITGLLIAHFVRKEDRTVQRPVEQVTAAERVRIEALPFPVERSDVDLLSQAQAHYQAGRFGDAVVYLYSHMLLQLDRVHLILLTRGKTNRQYLREARRAGKVGVLLEPVMVAFEDYYFGHHPLTRLRFDQCWGQIDSFHQAIQQAEQ